MANELPIGPHRVRVVGDTVLTRYIGVPELEHVQELHAHFDRVIAEHGHLFVINDMRRSGIPSTDTRKWIADWARANPIAGLVNFGAGLPIRVMQALVLRASAMFGRYSGVMPVHVANEAEAFAWIETHRREATPGG